MISSERKTKAVMNAAIGSHVVASDTQIIERPGWYQLITPSCKSSSLNEVIFSEFGPSDDVGVCVERVVSQYRAHSLPFKWCVGPWTKPTNLGSYLEKLGFDTWGVRGMVYEADALTVSAPHNVSVEELSITNVEEYVSTFSSGWGEEFPSERKSDLRSALLGELSPGSRRRFFLARMAGRAAGTASYFLRDDSAYLTGGNVLTEFRGKGIYRALIRARLDALQAISLPLATTHAREKTSAPILEKLGFETVFRYSIYELKPQKGGIHVS